MTKYFLCSNIMTKETAERNSHYYFKFTTICVLLKHYKINSIYEQYQIAVMEDGKCVEFLSLKKYINLL